MIDNNSFFFAIRNLPYDELGSDVNYRNYEIKYDVYHHQQQVHHQQQADHQSTMQFFEHLVVCK